MTVSPNSSVRLGWGWMNSATSSTVASQLTARYPPLSCSVTHGPTMCTPRMRPARPSAPFSAMIFARPSVSPRIIARELNLNGCLATTTSYPAALACSSSGPAHATSGWQ